MKIEEIEEKFNVRSKKSLRQNVFAVSMAADINDADYIYSDVELSIEEFERALPLLRAINEGKLTSYGVMKRDDYEITSELYEDFYNLVPISEYGAYSLEIREILFYDEAGTQWEIKL